jgi:hypothetical protein
VKPGDLARARVIWVGNQQPAYSGQLALVVGEPKWAGETEYVQVICDGIRMMPIGWLEPAE